MQQYQNYIGGAWVDPADGQYIENTNPANRNDIIGYLPNSSETDAANAVAAAKGAFPAWSAMAAPARGEFLRKTADLIEQRADQIAADLMREEGKSLPEAKGETLRGVAILRYYAAQTMLPDGEVIPSFGASTFLYTKRVPLGVVTLINPWNFPIAIPIWKAAPALAFGNTVVLKPSELSPQTANHIMQCFTDAGLPAGVLNIVHGTGSRVGEPLVIHQDVAAVSFTGSVKTGRMISAWCTAKGKKCQLEMGGKNASVVLADANIEQAVTLTIQGAFKSAGQKCTATSRAIIAAEIYDEFVDKLVTRTGALKVGPGTDSGAYLGPVITDAARERVLNAVIGAEAEGAVVRCGGAPTDPDLETGNYLHPVVVEHVRSDMKIWREEVFGPLLCVIKSESFDQSLELLNDCEYGLSASVFTRSLDKAMAFADKAQAGMVRINGETAGVEPQAPFGGMKASSSFSREQGLAARDFYTQIKTISIDRAEP